MRSPDCQKETCYPVGKCLTCLEWMNRQEKLGIAKALFEQLAPFGVTRIDIDGVTITVDDLIDNSKMIN